ncbi:conserved hypothetical protein [Coccidioides posadasii str. Silveira]|uniref:Pre-mRNA-splicing factor n=2 Tax=Coccidioides posadasii (strain RMSCC 757 / Silveira) TaxID=443226 RepID=E9D1Q5_COCPS|nr:conserved hypothetical protein [Coccidioides posadasii str. Silveira]
MSDHRLPSSSTAPSSKPFSISFASKTSTAPPPAPSISTSRRSNAPTPKSSTPRPGFHDHDSDASDAEPGEPTHEEVTGFDQSTGGAISKHARESKEKEPLVIKVDKRNGWRERLLGSTRAKKSWLPEEVRMQREAEREAKPQDVTVEVAGPSTKFGLSYASAPKTAEDEKATGAGTEIQEDTAMEIDTEATVEKKDLSHDELALRALISESKGETEQKSDLVIQSRGGSYNARSEYDETRSFRDDVAHRPDSATLAGYAAVPVEQFGAALLRGMGWKEGQPVGRGKYSDSTSQRQNTSLAPRIPERRPGYLGIGAKDLSGKAGAAELELGAWGKAAMRKGKPGEGLYTPVLMKSKKTGKMITEEEFKKITKEQEREKQREKEDEWKERRDRNLTKNGRRYDASDDDRDSRESSSRRNGRDRSRSSDRDRARDRDSRRRRRYDDDYDDRDRDSYDSEKRRKDDRRYRDRDSPRDRVEDSKRDRDRERDKDRDKDRDRDRDRDKYSDRERDRGRDRYKEREREKGREKERRRDYR